MRRFLPAHPNTNGTRTSALVAGRADTGDPSVVAVLRPLTVCHRTCWRKSGPAGIWRRLIFFCFTCVIEFCMRRAFSRKFRYDPLEQIIGSETRGEQQSRAIEDLGPGQFGQCAESTVVPART